MLARITPLLLIVLVCCFVRTQAQSWAFHEDLNGFITDIEYHNGQRYTAFKTGEVLLGDSIIHTYPVQLYQETGLLGICWWQDSLCVSISSPDSIQRIICGSDTLFEVSYKSPWAIRHRAGDMVAVDSILYVTFGDGSSPDSAQSLTDFRGKIVAIEADTSYIFAYGLRNPWKIDTTNGQLYIADVGHQTEEEVDRIPLDSIGTNFGWPCMEGTHVHDSTYSCDPTHLPLFTYPRAHTGNGIIGGKFFQGMYYWCDNYDKQGGMLMDSFWMKIPCPQYPDGMYVHGDTLFVYDYTGKIYRWNESPLSLDSIPEKEKPPVVYSSISITSNEIRWIKEVEGVFRIFSMDGRLVTTKIADGHRDSISISGYIPGIYAIVLTSRHGIQWSKLFAVIE